MKHYPRILLQSVMLMVLVFWSLGALWALLFGMTITGTIGLVGIPFLLQPWLNVPIPTKWMLTSSLIPILAWQTGWQEYKSQRIYFSCTVHQVYHSIHSDIPTWCPTNFRQPIDDWQTKPLFQQSERVGIWLHHLAESLYLSIAIHPLRGQQLRKMHTAATPIVDIVKYPFHQKRHICNVTGPTDGTTITRSSSMLSKSQAIQQTLASHLEEIATTDIHQTIQLAIETISPPPTYMDELLYPRAMLKLDFDRQARNWILTQPVVHSPQEATLFVTSLLHRELQIPIDNAMYCGLQMEGWLFPYREKWLWKEYTGKEDPRQILLPNTQTKNSP